MGDSNDKERSSGTLSRLDPRSMERHSSGETKCEEAVALAILHKNKVIAILRIFQKLVGKVVDQEALTVIYSICVAFLPHCRGDYQALYLEAALVLRELCHKLFFNKVCLSHFYVAHFTLLTHNPPLKTKNQNRPPNPNSATTWKPLKKLKGKKLRD